MNDVSKYEIIYDSTQYHTNLLSIMEKVIRMKLKYHLRRGTLIMPDDKYIDVEIVRLRR